MIVSKAEQEIVMTKWAGLEGTYIIAKSKKKELITKYTKKFVEGAERFEDFLSIDKERELAEEMEVPFIYAVGYGGIFAALWEIAQINNVGMIVDLKKILLRQETVEICEFFDLNPYMLLSGGSAIMITGRGNDLVDKLDKKGIAATIIGKVNNMKQRLVVNNGEKRYLTPSKKDEIFAKHLDIFGESIQV